MEADKAHQKAIESRYKGKCDVFEYSGIRDDLTKIVNHKIDVVAVQQPCWVSFSNSPVLSENGSTAIKQQTVKLFLSPEVPVKAGAKITVTQNGVTTEYASAGEAAIYASHQEINLELFRGWA